MTISKKLALLLFGFFLSHLLTALGLTIFSHRAFRLEYPFELMQFYSFSLLHFHLIPNKFHIFAVFYICMSLVPIIIYQAILERSTTDKYGYAKFAPEKMLKGMGLNFRNGIVFGLVRKGMWQKILNPFEAKKVIRSQEPLSVLLMAPPGTGKSAGVIIPTLLTLQNSVVVHDPKGELYDATHEARLKLGHQVMIFDIDEKDSIKFNPFAPNKLPSDPLELKPYVVNIANIIFKSHKENHGNTSYFVNAARNAFTTMATHLIYKEGYTSIIKIRDKILENSSVSKTFEQLKEVPLNEFKIPDAKLRKALETDINSVLVAASSPDQWAGVMGSLTEKLDYFSDPKIASIIDCEVSSFSADDLRSQKISIYLRVKDKDKAKLQTLVSMIFESLGTELISKNPKKSDNQITFILDEFVRLGRVDILTELTSISRGYNFNQIFVIQDLEQISNTYSREYMSILESNCAYKIIMKQNNFLTAEKIAKIIGFKTDTRTSTSKRDKASPHHNEGKSISKSEEGIYLVTPQDILNLDKNQCLIIVQGFAATPILADIAWWFKDKNLWPKKVISMRN